jgi:hypothetical protein
VRRNVILGLRKVDWSDETRQNEFLNCVISAAGHLGKKVSYDDFACISGCAFRACSPGQEMGPGAYHITNDMPLIEHTFRMLGYDAKLHKTSDYETDRQRVIDSVDRGVPLLTFEGVVSCSETCIISGYDDDGAVLLGYNPFMYIKDDHPEPHDSTGYFRKSDWHNDWSRAADGRMLIIGKPTALLAREETIRESLRTAVKLIRSGYAGHTYYAGQVQKDAEMWFLLQSMIVCMDCNVFQDKVYVAPFLREAKAVLKDQAETLEQGAKLYDQIPALRREMSGYFPDDLSMPERIQDKELRRQYAQLVLKTRDLEKSAADLLEKI